MTALDNVISKCKDGVCLFIQSDGDGDCLLQVQHRDFSEYVVWCGGVEIWRTLDREQAQSVYKQRRTEYKARLYKLSYAG